MQLAEFRISHVQGKLEQVVNNETEDNQPADKHRSRCERRSLVPGNGILLRLCQPVLVRQVNGGNDMGYKRGKQDSSHDPEDRSKAVQEFRVRIYLVLAHVDLQISDEMTDNVQNQN